MVTYIAKALYNHSFSFYSQLHTKPVHHFSHVTYFPYAKKNTETCCFPSSSNSTLRDRLPGNTTLCIYFTGAHTAVTIEYPRHFSLTCPVIRCRNINARTYKILFDKLCRIPPCNFFKVVHGVFPRVNGDTSLCTTKRHVHDCAFVCHQCGQRHYFIKVYSIGE